MVKEGTVLPTLSSYYRIEAPNGAAAFRREEPFQRIEAFMRIRIFSKSRNETLKQKSHSAGSSLN